MERLKLCVNTQTPLVRFRRPGTRRKRSTPERAVDLSKLAEGVDYEFSPGGVTRMVFPLVRRMLHDGTLGDAHWVSLDPSGPDVFTAGGIVLHSIHLKKERLKSYGNVKETLGGAAHPSGLDTRRARDIFWTDDFSEYAYYNRLSAELIGKLDQEVDFDVFYIHDFQQLPMGHMLATLKPKIYRWHIPFDDSAIPDQWRELLTTYFGCYDVVVVSTRKSMDSLKSFGYAGKIRKIYPYVDPREY